MRLRTALQFRIVGNFTIFNGLYFDILDGKDLSIPDPVLGWHRRLKILDVPIQ